jgi:hypothetical protein
MKKLMMEKESEFGIPANFPYSLHKVQVITHALPAER